MDTPKSGSEFSLDEAQWTDETLPLGTRRELLERQLAQIVARKRALQAHASQSQSASSQSQSASSQDASPSHGSHTFTQHEHPQGEQDPGAGHPD